jgi:hypothetical protein
MKDMEEPVIDFDLSARLLYEVDCQGQRERLLQYQQLRMPVARALPDEHRQLADPADAGGRCSI